MRDGPKPLSVHLGLAASSGPLYMEGAQKKPEEFEGELKKMLLGIQKYQQHSFYPQRLPLHEIWRKGEVAVCATSESPDFTKGAILFIPSLINKSYILDLLENRSMLRWFEEAGYQSYLLDWGDLCAEEGLESLEGLISGRLVAAIEEISSQHDGALHTLGYCMGGTLLAAANASQKLPVKSQVLLASPWDFHAGTKKLLRCVQFWAPQSIASMQISNHLSVQYIQTIFASLDPFSSVKKFSKFAEMDQSSDACHLFIAVEDWLNDGVSLPNSVALETLEGWFLKNQPAENAWEFSGSALLLENTNVPSLIVASKADRLVEYEMSLPFLERISQSELLQPGCGHIGMMAGNNVIEKVWQPILGWLKSEAS